MARASAGLVVVCWLASGCSPAAGSRARAEYDPQSGRLTRIEFDANRNGRHDATSLMDGARIRRIEIDLDENGKVERWDFYRPDRALEKVGLSRQNDGVLDAYAFYLPDGTLDRMEVSSRRDGAFDRVEFYQHGFLTRSEEDLDGNGLTDKWEAYRFEPRARAGEPSYVVTDVAFDTLGRGTPSRRFVYDGGRVVRVEVDRDGDGVFVVEPKR